MPTINMSAVHDVARSEAERYVTRWNIDTDLTNTLLAAAFEEFDRAHELYVINGHDLTDLDFLDYYRWFARQRIHEYATKTKTDDT